MPELTKEQIRDADDLPREKVIVSEWMPEHDPNDPPYVWVRTLSGQERDQFEAECFQQNGRSRRFNLENIRARLAILSVVNEDGSPKFTRADLTWLCKKSARPLDRIFAAAQKLNGMTDEDIDELAKNFESGQSDGFGFSLPTAGDAPSESSSPE